MDEFVIFPGPGLLSLNCTSSGGRALSECDKQRRRLMNNKVHIVNPDFHSNVVSSWNNWNHLTDSLSWRRLERLAARFREMHNAQLRASASSAAA